MIHRSNRAIVLATLVFGASALIASSAEHQTSSSATISQQQQQQQQQNDVAQAELAETKKRAQDAYLQQRPDLDKYQELHDEADEISQLREPDYYYYYLERLLSKRASMRGFQGMRGKKSDYEAYPSELYSSMDKKSPMGFQGMRGKKTYLDEDEAALDKRAPYSAFQGVRGKKSLEEVLMEELEKRARMAGFQGMRGKKTEVYEEEEQQQQQQQQPEWQKRAPSRGFQGMRGRKSMLEQYYDDELVKRALNSFHGMRGKKDMLYEPDSSSVAGYTDNNYIDKRPMMMSFHGMRGKRSANYYEQEQAAEPIRYEKRSPYRFFGSRGKKNPRWESRARGFVGVRGKRLEAPRQLAWPVSIYDELELAAAAAAAAAAEDLNLPERH